ncbi:alpha/beta fold hydrolase [Micromonospora sp. NBS 11-29]|uniref:alpha/beta fold hydrolase n=1 Tax=Micromonospora sp. NBS 11-29 TaxID=1960879 RepID=UPI0015947EE8|nr:alpha/beta fold hydrolase [Micromonospora sp. NBS 11-29]
MTDVGATRVHWTRDGAGPPLVLLHGLGGDISFWDADHERLAPDFDVITVDLRGSGATAGSEELTIGELAEDVRAVLDDAGVQRAHTLGFSLGGLVALELALTHPDRVGGLILASTYARMGAQARRFLDAVLDVYSRGATNRQMYDLIAPWLFSASFVADPANAGFFNLTDADLEDQGRAEWCALYRAQQAFDVTARLGELTARTLILTGQEDHLVSPHDTRVLTNGIGGAQQYVFHAAGHLVNVERPDEFLDVVRDFLLPSE